MEKIFIITTLNDDIKIALDIAEYISDKYDLDIATTYITNATNNDYKQYFAEFSLNDMILAFKNNAMLYCLTKNSDSIGISMDEYYNNDIFCMNVEAFNNISESILMNAIIVWIDGKSRKSSLQEMNNVKILISLLDSIPYLYFNENSEYIKNVLSEYIEANPIDRKLIIEENS